MCKGSDFRDRRNHSVHTLLQNPCKIKCIEVTWGQVAVCCVQYLCTGGECTDLHLCTHQHVVCAPLGFSVYVYMHFIHDWIQMRAPCQSFGSEGRVCNLGWQSLRVSIGLCKQLRAAAFPLQCAEDAHSIIKGNWGTCGLRGQRQIMCMRMCVNKQTHGKKASNKMCQLFYHWAGTVF